MRIAAMTLILALFCPKLVFAVTIWVNQQSDVVARTLYSGSGTCSIVDANTSPANPLKGPAGNDGLKQALGCANMKPSERVDIYVLCTDPDAGTNPNKYCSYTNPGTYTLNAAASSTTKHVLRGVPDGLVHLEGGNKVHVSGSFWEIRGFTFDGLGLAGTKAYVRLTGTDIDFRYNVVQNMRGSCITLFSTGNDQAARIRIENNIIRDCNDQDPNLGEAHCIHNLIGDAVTVKYNNIFGCEGDGYQTERYQETFDPNVSTVDAVAVDTKIIGNAFGTACKDWPGFPGRTLGENAVDIKRTGVGLLIAENLAYGYKTSRGTEACRGSGTGSRGEAIAIHGDVDGCTGSTCVIIEGNDVLKSQKGIVVGDDTTHAGSPRGVTIRGNWIHDMRGLNGDSSIQRAERGLAIEAASMDTTQPSAIYRNTISNVPGTAFRITSLATWNVFNNLIAGVSACAPTKMAATTVGNNWFFDAIDFAGVMNPQGNPSFIQPFNVTGAACGSGTKYSMITPANTTCGAIDCLADPPATMQLEYDYRLTPTSPADGEVGSALESSTTYPERITEFGSAICGARPALGASETCGAAGPKKIYMLDDSGDAGDDRYDGDAWYSPDIGYAPVTSVFAPSSFGADPLPSETILVGQEGRLYLRIRSTSAPFPPISVRIIGADAHTDLHFPSGFEELFNGFVQWGATPTCTNCGRVGGDANAQIYYFPWTPTGASREKLKIDLSAPEAKVDSHYCLRAIVSTEGDWRPPPFTGVQRSNNIAQRNVFIARYPVEKGQLGITAGLSVTEGPDIDPAFIGLFVQNGAVTGRPVHLWVPETEAGFFRDVGTQPFPPDDPDRRGQLITVAEGKNSYDLAPDSTGKRFVQLLVDNRTAGAPSSSEYVFVRQDTETRGGVTWFLQTPGLMRDSFELLSGTIPRGWEKSGIWRTVDHYASTCGTANAAAYGRRSMALNQATTCNYDTGARVQATLESPSLAWSATSKLRFEHWSETERYAGYDVRRVTITIREGLNPVREVELASWSGPDHGSSGVFVQQEFDLTPHWVANSTIKVQFRFDSIDALYNNYSGWHIDNVEVQ